MHMVLLVCHHYADFMMRPYSMNDMVIACWLLAVVNCINQINILSCILFLDDDSEDFEIISESSNKGADTMDSIPPVSQVFFTVMDILPVVKRLLDISYCQICAIKMMKVGALLKPVICFCELKITFFISILVSFCICNYAVKFVANILRLSHTRFWMSGNAANWISNNADWRSKKWVDCAEGRQGTVTQLTLILKVKQSSY